MCQKHGKYHIFIIKLESIELGALSNSETHRSRVKYWLSGGRGGRNGQTLIKGYKISIMQDE